MEKLAYSQKEINQSRMSTRSFKKLAKEFGLTMRMPVEHGYCAEIKGPNKTWITCNEYEDGILSGFEILSKGANGSYTRRVHANHVRRMMEMYQEWNQPGV